MSVKQRSNVLLCTTLICFANSFIDAGESAQLPDVPADRGFIEVAAQLQQEYGAVRFHRTEEFEDQFIVRGTLSALTVEHVPHIFQVQSREFEVVHDSLVVSRGNGLPPIYLAKSWDNGILYKLNGFPSAEQEFNRLVADGPAQRISNTADAEQRGLLCAEIVYGIPSAWWVDGESSVELKAAQHFFDEGHKDGLILGQKWWKSFKGDRSAIHIVTAKLKDGFIVTLPIFWAPVEGSFTPEIKLYRIEIGATGSCHMQK